MSVIPVTILGGFLGAGKTTAVNRLLRDAAAGTVVLVNDFGAIDIDGLLIAGREGEVLALANGCVCCSIGPDFSATLGKMLARRPPPARIVIEASGVSDPWRIAQLVKLERTTRVAAVIVLADAEAFAAQAADRWIADTLQRQVARADIVALTKCDIATDGAKAAARAAIVAMRPEVPVVETAQGEIPAALMDAHAGDEARRFLADAPGHGFASWTWSPPAPPDRARLEAVLRALPGAVLRVKGLLRFGADPRLHVVQMVGRRWAIEPWDDPWDEKMDGDRAAGLVVIGTAAMPDAGALAAMFAQALG